MRKKKWVAPFLQEETEYLISDLCDIPAGKPVYLEIGMGMGDFICESAEQHEDIFYVGLEREETCVARAIKKARDRKLNNFRVMLADADHISELIKENSVDLIYLHFPDPWPKKRNHKRRLTYPPFLEKYAGILKKDGLLIFKSDNAPFFEDSLTYFAGSAFALEECDRDYYREGEPMTAYQRRFHEQGVPINYARYRVNKV